MQKNIDKNTEKSEQQLDMGFKEPFSNKIKKFQYKAGLFFVKLRTNSLFKSPALWILSILTISLLFVQKNYYDKYLEQMPKEIPLLTIRESLELRLVDSNYLFYVLLISIFLTAVSIVLAVKNYYQFKSLSIMILGNLFLAMCLITIAYIKIFGIYLF